MKNWLSASGVLWMAAGTAFLVICLLGVVHVQRTNDPAAQLAFRARRVDLVERIQLDLASASEAEKSAVLAITDQDSRTFADQVRAATARADQERRELAEVLAAGGTPGEKDTLAQFTAAFAELQRIDEELLALAVKNTNVKAYALAYGPAAAAVKEMNAALDRLVAAESGAPGGKTAVLLAFGAETSALRIETLLPPHIAEENDAKMDALEASMASEDAQVRKGLDGLAAIPKLGKDPDLAAAAARYAEFTRIRTQILSLSRENTNVRSLSISLNERRKAMLACQDSLSSLRQAILAEPTAGVDYGPPAKPR